MSKKLATVLARTAIGIVAFMIVLFVAGIVIGYHSAHGTLNPDQAMVWLVGATAVSMMVGAMVVSVAWMRSIDEAAREAHKAAWFWGGCSGMSIGGVLVIMSSLPQAAKWTIPSWFEGRTDPAAYAATGAFGMLLIMSLGYAVAWVIWWLRRR